MMNIKTLAFKDDRDGYYQIDLVDGDDLPEWTIGMTPCVVQAMIVEKPSYADLRAAEYPPMTDYLDGIVKGDKAQVQDYIDACKAVKMKYPKPAA